MAESADNIWFTAGVHPNHAHDQDDYDNLDAYRALSITRAVSGWVKPDLIISITG